MIPFAYRATIRGEGPGEFLVTFPAIPEAITGGRSFEEAVRNAHGALSVALDGYLVGGLTIPPPDAAAPADGGSAPLVAVSPAVAARAILHREMTVRDMSQSEMGRLMKRDEKTVRRALAGRGASLDMTLKALAALGVFPALAL